MTKSQPLRRLLFVSRQFPGSFETAQHGIFQRMRMLLDAAAEVAQSLDILFFADEATVRGADVAELQRMLEQHWKLQARIHLCAMAQPDSTRWQVYGAPALSIRHHPDFAPTATAQQADCVASLLTPDTDLVVAHRLHAAVAVFGRSMQRPPVVLDLDDVEHVKYYRELRRPPFWLGKALHFLHVPALAAGEIRSVRRAATTFVCSDTDCRYVQRIAGTANVEVVPNAIDLSQAAWSEPSASPCVLFVGAYSYRPNVEAAEILVREVFPLIRQQRPDARLLLVGNKAEQLPFFGETLPGVEVLGFVDDLAEVYQQAAVVCCPIRSGSGTRIKIIEAASRGVPVVSTSMGAEGLVFEDGPEIVLRDAPQAMAQACLALMQDRPRALAIGRQAREKARFYDRGQTVARIAERYRAMAAAPQH